MLQRAHNPLVIITWLLLLALVTACGNGTTEDVSSGATEEVSTSPTEVTEPTADHIAADDSDSDCPWDESMLAARWQGDGGSLVLSADGNFAYAPSGRLPYDQRIQPHGGTWECVAGETPGVILTRAGGQQIQYTVDIDLSNGLLVIDQAKPTLIDYDYFRGGIRPSQTADFVCPWDESMIIGYWEGDRTVLSSGIPRGGTVQFIEPDKLVVTTQDEETYEGTWDCADSPIFEIILTTPYGNYAKREVIFVNENQISLERVEKPGFYRDYFLVAE